MEEQQPELQQLVKQVFFPANEQESSLSSHANEQESSFSSHANEQEFPLSSHANEQGPPFISHASEQGPSLSSHANEQESIPANDSLGDYEVALRLHMEERQRQEELDAQMAQQIQLREHTFLAPTSEEHASRPPRPLLPSILTEELRAERVRRLAGEEEELSKKTPSPQSHGAAAKRSPVVTKASNPPPRKVATITKRTELTTKSAKRKKGVPKTRKVATAIPPPPPPPPPPLPPPPPPPLSRTSPNVSSAGHKPSPWRFLQPVETIVKRAFKVGEFMIMALYTSWSSLSLLLLFPNPFQAVWWMDTMQSGPSSLYKIK